MAIAEDNTSEIVNRYIEDLLASRAAAAQSSPSCDSGGAAVTLQRGSSSPASVPEQQRMCPLENEAFRQVMISRFQRLRDLANESSQPSVQADTRKRRAKPVLCSLLIGVVGALLVYRLAWSETDTDTDKISLPARPIDAASKQADQGRLDRPEAPSPTLRVVQEQDPVSARHAPSALPAVAPAAPPQDLASFWPAVAHKVCRASATASELMASPQAELAVTLRARRRIVRLLNVAVNDRILGVPAAARVARIEFQPHAAGLQVAHSFVADVLNASGGVVGKASGTYTARPESLSASVLYGGGNRVNYTAHYFRDKF